ncbi:MULTISPECIES: hypothetical protein [Sphingobium]|jgi:hypothetical protein|uniref:hypothetical protein n=1 Tax=Sphingobium TaxID=165695 RepID=UPI000DBB6822|nr:MULTISPECIES: hypothetical protein [Sphingobium]KAA9011355.1 hypothetical protein F4U94_20805 [Sphingobium limneticum]BBD02232.1 hypothetical protein YGS_C2P0245 [Sphingobium sp. YG1]
MTHQCNLETVNRFAIAAAKLLRHELDQEFAADGCSVIVIAGPALDKNLLDKWTIEAGEQQMDIVYLAFEAGREHLGPTSASIFAERSGVVFRFTDCALWSPKDDGPLLIMPFGLNVCFGHDDRALVSFPSRPNGSLRSGVARARLRLRLAANAVPSEHLRHVQTAWPLAA